VTKRGLEVPCNLTHSKAERHTVESSISGYGGLQAPSNYSVKRETSQLLICVHNFDLIGRLLYEEGCLLVLCITLDSEQMLF
jgi:hypothetical protein